MRFRTSIALLLSASLLPIAQTGAQPPAKKRLVAMVAIGKYQNDNPWTASDNAEKVAAQLLDVFQSDFGFSKEIAPLYGSNGAATLDGINAQLDQLERLNTSEDDQVIFYFVGHGVTKDGGGLLVPYDAPPLNGDSGKFLKMSALLERLRRLKANQVLVVLDSCHSGVAVPQQTSYTDPLSNSKIRIVLTSTGADQIALDDGNHPPLLTTELLDILHRNTCDFSGKGYCTVFELGMLARRMVVEEADRQHNRQTPVWAHFGGDEDGDFRLDRLDAETVKWQNLTNAEANGQLMDEAKINEFVSKLGEFANNPSSLYSEQAREREQQLEIKLITDQKNPTISNFKGLIMQPSDAGKLATNKHDTLVYVWTPKDAATGIGDFWIGQTEVSVEAYFGKFQMVRITAPGYNRHWNDKNQPMVNVSYQDAKDFCAAGYGRLPTLKEWEFAAGGGAFQNFPWVGDQKPHAELVNMAGVDRKGPKGYPAIGQPVSVTPNESSRDGRMFLANPLNMYHVLGNVAEWTAQAKPSDPFEVVGGSFADPYDETTLQSPTRVDPHGANTIGFRCVIDPRN